MAVHVTAEGPVTIVAIDRPDVRNAVDPETAEALGAAFRAFADDDGAAVAVLTGAGGTFCAGADLHAVSAGAATEMLARADGPMGPTHLALDKPVIAAVEGYAVAGGLELALWCDLRVAAEDAVFGVFCRRWGVPLVDGGSVRLPRLVGQGRAMDMILTGRPVGAEEAERIGLVDRVVAPGGALPAAIALAAEIAAFPQACMRADRRSALAQWSLDVDVALAREREGGVAVVRSGETVEGAARFAGGAGRHGGFGDG
jgi:enoyl-CoA hydratase